MKRLYWIGVCSTLINLPVYAEVPILGSAIPDVSLVSSFSALCLVLFCIFGLAWLIKKTKNASLGVDKRTLRVIEQISLGHKERLVLVKVGDQQMVLGVTPHNVTLLDKLETPLAECEASGLPTSFQQVFQAYAKK